MKLTTIILVAAAAMMVFAQSAQAREHYRYHRYHAAHFARHYSSPGPGDHAAQNMFAGHGQNYFGQSDLSQNYSNQNYSNQVYPERNAYDGHIGAHVGGRPSAWCGWDDAAAGVRRSGASVQPGAQLGALGTGRTGGVGAVVVWSHHVGKIVGQEGGRVDHRVRQRRQPGPHPAALARRRHRHPLGMIGPPDTAIVADESARAARETGRLLRVVHLVHRDHAAAPTAGGAGPFRIGAVVGDQLAVQRLGDERPSAGDPGVVIARPAVSASTGFSPKRRSRRRRRRCGAPR